MKISVRHAFYFEKPICLTFSDGRDEFWAESVEECILILFYRISKG